MTNDYVLNGKTYVLSFQLELIKIYLYSTLLNVARQFNFAIILDKNLSPFKYTNRTLFTKNIHKNKL